MATLPITLQQFSFLKITKYQVIPVQPVNPRIKISKIESEKFYKLQISIKNTSSDSDEEEWYDNISLRIIPRNIGITFRPDLLRLNETWVTRYDPPYFRLIADYNYNYKDFEITFKYENNEVPKLTLSELQFDIAIYANTLIRTRTPFTNYSL